jgi:tRNA (guanine-N7-)-methyltransferase
MSTPPTRQPGVRTFTPRWRNSPLTDERMARLMPRHGIPDGPLVPEQAFGRRAPLVLEVGSGHGAAAIGYAAAHPGEDVLAVDVHVPGLARTMAAAEEAGVSNLWVHNGDAIPLLEERIAPGSLRAIHLFFPDPWLKKRHAKRRFVQPYTLALLADRLEPGGLLLIATDQDSYARHALRHLAEHGGFDVETGERPEWRPLDGFEVKGRRAGREITEITARLR